MPNSVALFIYNEMFDKGRIYNIRPAGLEALDLLRIGLVFATRVDFMVAEEAIRPGTTRSPFELGLSWLVDLNKPVFNGKAALKKRKEARDIHL